MPFSDLTITRTNLNEYEANTLSRYNNTSGVLGLFDSDGDMLNGSIRTLKQDILTYSRDVVIKSYNGDQTAYLNELYDADTENQLVTLLTQRFFATFFSDSMFNTRGTSSDKSSQYAISYSKGLISTLRTLQTKLTPPQSSKRLRWGNSFA